MKLHIAVDSGSNYRGFENVGIITGDLECEGLNCVGFSGNTVNYGSQDSKYSVGGSDITCSMVPLSICTEECDFKDDETLDIAKMVDYFDNTKLPSHTACPSVAAWKDNFAGNKNVIAITLSGSLSGCYNACRLAAEEYMEENSDCKVFAYDTKMIGPAEKLCTEFAARRFCAISSRYKKDSNIKDEYLNFYIDKLCDEIDDYCSNHLKTLFCLETLNNLANNGRIGKAVAAIAMTLKINIVGEFTKDGELKDTDKCRGSRKSVETIYKNMKASGYKGGKVLIDHCFALKKAENLKSLVLNDFPKAEVRIGIMTGLCSFYAEKGGLVLTYEK